RVVFSVSRPRPARHFPKDPKPPVRDIRVVHSEIVAHGRRDIEASPLIQIGFWAVIAKHILPVIGAERSGVFPLRINGSIAFADCDPSIFASRNSGSLIRFFEPGDNAFRFRAMACGRLVVVRKCAIEWILSWWDFCRDIMVSF